MFVCFWEMGLGDCCFHECLDANLLHDNAFGVGRASERIALVLGAKVRLLVVLVCPALFSPLQAGSAQNPLS